MAIGCGTTVDYGDGDGVDAAYPTQQDSTESGQAESSPAPPLEDSPVAAASAARPSDSKLREPQLRETESTEPQSPLFATGATPSPSSQAAGEAKAVAPEDLFESLSTPKPTATAPPSPKAAKPEAKTAALAPWQSAPTAEPEPADTQASPDKSDDQFANLFANVLGGDDSQPAKEAAAETESVVTPAPPTDPIAALFGDPSEPAKPAAPEPATAVAESPTPDPPETLPPEEPIAAAEALAAEAPLNKTPPEPEAAELPWLAGASGEAEPTPAAKPEEPRVASLEPSPRVDPPPVSTPIDVDNTRHLAWLLGSKISLTGLSHVSPDQPVVGQPWQLTAIAELLSLEPPIDLAAATAGTTPARAISSVLAETRRLAAELAPKQGDDHAALVEVAVKSNALLLIYQQNPALAEPIRRAVSAAALRADLPPDTWRPLVALLEGAPTDAELRAEVFRLHESVERSLRR